MKTQNPLSAAIMAKTIISCLVMVMCLGNSCKKDDNLIEATVVDYGREAVDGCGWLIEVDEKLYYPTNLSIDFQQNGKKIRIRYKSLNEKQQCGFPTSETFHSKIELLEVKKL